MPKKTERIGATESKVSIGNFNRKSKKKYPARSPNKPDIRHNFAKCRQNEHTPVRVNLLEYYRLF